MTIASALPFAIIMLIAAVGMWRALVIEGHHEASLKTHMRSGRHGTDASARLWKKRLAGLVDFPPRKEVEEFIATKVVDSMQKVKQELIERGWPANVTFDAQQVRALLEVTKPDQLDFIYEIRLKGYAMPTYVFPALDNNPADNNITTAPTYSCGAAGRPTISTATTSKTSSTISSTWRASKPAISSGRRFE